MAKIFASKEFGHLIYTSPLDKARLAQGAYLDAVSRLELAKEVLKTEDSPANRKKVDYELKRVRTYKNKARNAKELVMKSINENPIHFFPNKP